MNLHEELFLRLLDQSAALLAAPHDAGLTIPDDELHREIIVPLLPAMLVDAAIRGHWNEQHATGFPARLARYFENGDTAPRWLQGDFEIHVTASYSAGADARALADTLLSEESLRDMTAALMNQLLAVLWPSLVHAPAELAPAFEIPVSGDAPAAEKIQATAIPLEPEPKPEPKAEPALPIAPATNPFIAAVGAAPETSPFAAEPEHAEEIRPAESGARLPQHSRILIRARCRKLPASLVQRSLAANDASQAASAAIVARRIFQRAKSAWKKKRKRGRTACLG